MKHNQDKKNIYSYNGDTHITVNKKLHIPRKKNSHDELNHTKITYALLVFKRSTTN